MFETTLQQALEAFDQARLEAGPLPSGSAPHTSSSSFKTKQCVANKPNARCWDHHFSKEAGASSVSTLKTAMRGIAPTDMISLSVARPSPEYYPWESMIFNGVGKLAPGDETPAHSITSMCGVRGEQAYDLDVALNYGYAVGSPQVLRFITEHVELIHNPPYSDWECSLTCGTTSALHIAFRLLCNRGDWILAEAYSYSGAVETAKYLGVQVAGVAMDSDGLLPDDLDAKLRGWDPAKGKKPGVLYTIPTGHNPTGTTQPRARRDAIYAVAEQHDLLIIEDDPYYFLQLGGEQHIGDTSAPACNGAPHAPLPEEYISQLPVSYLSLDTSGRVIRLDATSKILAPGLRCNWMTASAQIIRKFATHTEFSTIAPAGPSQLLLYKLLDQTWGHAGLLNWLLYLSAQYRRRRDVLVAACARWLPKDVCAWRVPSAGMFLWLRLDCARHPDYTNGAGLDYTNGAGLNYTNGAGLDDTRVLQARIQDHVYTQCMENGVMVSKGSWFAAQGEASAADVCFRMTFAAAAEHALDEGVRRFADAVRTEFGLV